MAVLCSKSHSGIMVEEELQDQSQRCHTAVQTLLPNLQAPILAPPREPLLSAL